MRHLLSARDLSRDEATAILDDADRFRQALLGRDVKKLPTLRGRTIITMFYENSTRTRVSFEVAGKWMSADVINVSSSGSSVAKGESLRDTALTLRAAGADALIIRHPASGAAQQLAEWTLESDGTGPSVINAGRRHPRTSDPGTAGRADHPPAPRRYRGPPGRHRRRRPAQPGGPVQRRPAEHPRRGGRAGGATDPAAGWGGRLGRSDDLPRPGRRTARCRRRDDAAGAGRADERRILPVGAGVFDPLTGCPNVARRLLPEHAVVLHPGPMLRGMEIAFSVPDSSQSAVLQQVSNGVHVRMAVLFHLLVGTDEAVSV